MVLVSPKSAKKNHIQKFRADWLKDPQLRDWLGSKNVVLNDGSIEKRPKCLYCNKILCVRYGDLVKHSQAKRHLQNAGHTHTTINKVEVFRESSTVSRESSGGCDQDDDDTGRVTGGNSSKVEEETTDGMNDIEPVEQQQPHPESLNTLQQVMLERQKVELEQERVKLYILKLDALKAEKSLGIKRSSFTKDL